MARAPTPSPHRFDSWFADLLAGGTNQHAALSQAARGNDLQKWDGQGWQSQEGRGKPQTRLRPSASLGRGCTQNFTQSSFQGDEPTRAVWWARARRGRLTDVVGAAAILDARLGEQLPSSNGLVCRLRSGGHGGSLGHAGAGCRGGQYHTASPREGAFPKGGSRGSSQAVGSKQRLAIAHRDRGRLGGRSGDAVAGPCDVEAVASTVPRDTKDTFV